MAAYSNIESNWAKTDRAQMVLLFAQAFREAVSFQAFESYRAHSLCGVSRLEEAIEALKKVSEGKLNPGAIKPIMDELKYFIDSDYCAKSISPVEINYLLSEKLDNKEILRTLKVIHTNVSDVYLEKLRQIIIECIDNDKKEKKKLIWCAQQLASILINSEYSRSYIHDSIKDVFSTRYIKNVNSNKIGQIFSKFTNKENSFNIIIGINIDLFLHLKSVFPQLAKTKRDLPKYVRNIVNNSQDLNIYQHFALLGSKSLDIYTASINAARQLSRICSIYHTSTSMLNLNFSNQGIAYSNQPSKSKVIPFSNSASIPWQTRRHQLSQTSFFFMNTIVSNFKQVDAGRLILSIDTASASNRYQDPKSTLISHWSAFETAADQPSNGEVRITKYSSDIIPVLCINYIQRTIYNLHIDLFNSFGRQYLESLGEIDGVGKHDYKVLMHILLKNEGYENLFKVLTDSPWHIQKCFVAHKRFGTPGNCLKSINSHENKISWQLSRIYRARNSITHSGSGPENIESLIINVRDYYNLFASNIISLASTKKTKTTIDTMIAEYKIKYHTLKNEIDKVSISDQNWSTDTITNTIPDLLMPWE